jgi:hypothetical protein
MKRQPDFEINTFATANPSYGGRDAYAPRNLFEQRLQILEDFVFFLRKRAIGEKELLAHIHCLSFQCRGV